MRKILTLTVLIISTLNLFSQTKKGFFDFDWNEETGELILEIPKSKIGYKFLYVNSLAAGVGSNDIGLDRGQLGGERVVSFYKSGKKILLIEDNLKYRGNDRAATGGTDHQSGLSIVQQNSWRHGGQHPLTRRYGIAITAHHTELVGHADLGTEIIHLVVEEKTCSIYDYF